MGKTKEMLMELIEKGLSSMEEKYDKTNRPKNGNSCCPNCKSEKIEDASIYNNNGVFGPGSATWKIFDAMVCGDCGVIFRKIENNKSK